MLGSGREDYLQQAAMAGDDRVLEGLQRAKRQLAVRDVEARFKPSALGLTLMPAHPLMIPPLTMTQQEELEDYLAERRWDTLMGITPETHGWQVDARGIVYAPRMQGKRMLVEALTKRAGGVVVKSDGSFRWDGKRWKRLTDKELRPA